METTTEYSDADSNQFNIIQTKSVKSTRHTCILNDFWNLTLAVVHGKFEEKSLCKVKQVKLDSPK